MSFFEEGTNQIQQNAAKLKNLTQLVIKNHTELTNQIQKNTENINNTLDDILKSASAAYIDNTTKIVNQIDKLNEKLDEYIYKQKQNGSTNLFYADTTQSQMFTESEYIKAVNAVIEACELTGTLHRHITASNKDTIKSFYKKYTNFFSLLSRPRTIIISAIIFFGMAINTAAKDQIFLGSNSNNTTNFTEWHLSTNTMYTLVSRALSRVLAEGISMTNKLNITGGSAFKSMKTLLFTKLKTIYTSKICGITAKLLPEDKALLNKTSLPNTDTSFPNFINNLILNGNPMPKIPAHIQYTYHLNVEKPVFLAFIGIIKNNFQNVGLLDTPNNEVNILPTPQNEVINALQNIDAKSYMQTINTQIDRLKTIPLAEMKSILKLSTLFDMDHIRGVLDATNQNKLVEPSNLQNVYITSTIKNELSTLVNANKIQSSISNAQIQITSDVWVVTDQVNEITQYQITPIFGAFLKCASKKTFEIAYNTASANQPIDIDVETINAMKENYPGILNQMNTLIDFSNNLNDDTKNTLMTLNEEERNVINILARIYSAVVTNVEFLTNNAMSSSATYIFLLIVAAGEMYTNDLLSIAGGEIPEQLQLIDYLNTTEIGDNILSAQLQPSPFPYRINNTEVTPFIAAVVGHFLPLFNFLINESAPNSFAENNDTYALQPQETNYMTMVITAFISAALHSLTGISFPL